jgi:hypothetical protein
MSYKPAANALFHAAKILTMRFFRCANRENPASNLHGLTDDQGIENIPN